METELIDQFGEEAEEALIKHGGGGGSRGRKREFGGEHRGEKEKERLAKEAREADPLKRQALLKINEKIFAIIKKDKSAECREIGDYFQWVRIGLLCATEIERIRKDKAPGEELPWDMMMGERYLKRKTTLAGGAGGQNVQKRSTAVQLTHLPTGIRTESEEERSQDQNNSKAHERMQEALMKHLDDWIKIIGEREADKVMAELLQKIIENKHLEKGPTGERLKKIHDNLVEGINL